jgi:hypothetical protein
LRVQGTASSPPSATGRGQFTLAPCASPFSPSWARSFSLPRPRWERLTQRQFEAGVENGLYRAARAARKGDRAGVAAIEAQLAELGRAADALGFRCEKLPL